ncbi:DUF3927 family protein, partial [Escherichia coli]|uniref:DUF3927 family protein n=1 Tax=Escherichia coli TaxID=562 RepID=UPI0011250EA8
MTVKLRLTVAALLLFLVGPGDATRRIMSVLAAGVLFCGLMVLLWPVLTGKRLPIACFFHLLFIKITSAWGYHPAVGQRTSRYH